MARLITLSFPASNTQLLLSTVAAGGIGATVTLIPLNNPYPFVFPNLARKITLTSTDDLSAINFTITGTNQFGNASSEVLAGPNNNTVASANQYNTIISITASGAYTNFSIGSGATGTFQWIKVNTMSTFFQGTITGEVTGTITYQINETLDALEYSKNISSNIGQGSTLSYFVNTTPVSFPFVASGSISTITPFASPVTAFQGIVTASTGGSLIINILQQGLT